MRLNLESLRDLENENVKVDVIKFHKMTDKTQGTHELLIEEIERENEVESLISEYNYGHGF